MEDLQEINPEIINFLFEEGGVFIFLDVPVGTEFGIDMKIWNTAEHFKGVKMIPPGMHYIHYSTTDNYGEVRPRSGFFHNFKKQEFLVRKWDKKLEDISPIVPTEDEVKRFKDNARNVDKYLGCYPYDIYQRWTSLSNHLHGK